MSFNLPNLPGYNIAVTQKKNFAKSHVFVVKNGCPTTTDRETDIMNARTFRVGDNNNTLPQNQPVQDFNDARAAKYSSMPNNTSSLPAWVAYDRKVLRFYAYFKEAVFSSPAENFRLRKCVLYYYLEDDSVHIAEPKVENSGIPQGVFVKRHRIPKDGSNEFINLNDLFIGNDIMVYGRKFHLHNADEFTRSFFAETGRELSEAEYVPSDPFTRKHTVEVGTHKKQMHPMKEFMEASMGKQMGINIQSTQKFLKNDGRVLRFYCVWEDEKMYGEKRPYMVHYFLADDTLEVMEVKQANSGRDPFPALLKRKKVPKKFEQTRADLSNIGSADSAKVQYYTEADIRVGSTINVYGHNLQVKGCDAFTKQFYKDNYGLTDADFPSIEEDQSYTIPATIIEPPEHNGFGTEEDSLGSFLYLIPKVPKRDFKKMMECDGLKMRFLCKFVNPSAEDRNREFILMYDMSDDTISMFEKFERNAGFIGGKFMEKSRVRRPDGEYYSTQDLLIGGQVVLNSFKFEIKEADQFTQNFMRNNPDYFPAQQQQGEEGEEANPEVKF